MRILLAAATALLCVLLAPLASAAFGLPEPVENNGRGQVVADIYSTVTVMGIVIFLIVFVWLVVVIVRFRAGTGHGRATHEKERHSLGAELAWTLVPLAMVLYIGYAAYGGMVALDHDIDTTGAPELRITGSQYNWEMDYGDGLKVASSPDPQSGAVKPENAFVVPADTPLMFNITSSDVIHAFHVADANHGFVMMNDANPLGSNKYARQPVIFPAGEYQVQCREMCLNPGHAYMRAHITAVSQEEFVHWKAGRMACLGQSIQQTFKVTLGADNRLLGTDGNPIADQTVVAGTCLKFDLQPTGRDVSFTGPFGRVKTIPANTRTDTFFNITVPDAGNYTVFANQGPAVTFTGVTAKQLKVELGPFKLLPPEIKLKANERYLVEPVNTHSAVHNLFIGHWDGKGEQQILAQSPDAVSPGSSGPFLVQLPAGRYDMWCNVPGHYGLGMVGTVVVS
jgi:cytochrome c oxidase subunit 2